MNKTLLKITPAIGIIAVLVSCSKPSGNSETEIATEVEETDSNYLSQPLITDNFTADPSAHVFDGKIYIYPSHDIESNVPQDDLGSHFNMMDYHVYSMDSPTATVVDEGKVLAVEDIPWAKRQLWAPDAAEKDGKYYLYFPAKDENDIFKIGVAVGIHLPDHSLLSRKLSKVAIASILLFLKIQMDPIICISEASGEVNFRNTETTNLMIKDLLQRMVYLQMMNLL